jgi:DinB superfamily
MKVRILFIACCVVFSAASIFGQNARQPGTSNVPNEASLNFMQNGQTNVLADLRGGFKEVNDWVTKAADMVPAEKYNYKPADTVRTFGQLIGHITDSYNYFCARGAGKQVEWADPAEKGTTDKATLIPKLKQAVEACNAAYGSDAGQFRPLFTNVGHTSLHYGNIITYMRMMGMKPPSS